MEIFVYNINYIYTNVNTKYITSFNIHSNKLIKKNNLLSVPDFNMKSKQGNMVVFGSGNFII